MYKSTTTTTTTMSYLISGGSLDIIPEGALLAGQLDCRLSWSELVESIGGVYINREREKDIYE